jgi:hypothetical protein
MTDEKLVATPSALIETAATPEIFADAVVGYHILNGVVKVALGSVRMTHGTGTPSANRVVVGRLVMSVPAARNLAVGLFEFLKSQGVDVKGAAANTQAT